MFSKEEVKKSIMELQKLSSFDEQSLEKFIINIDNMTNEKFNEILESNNIRTKKDVNSFIQTAINKEKLNINEEKFANLNQTIGYGVNGDTLHLHVMPAELKDALSKNGRRRLSLEVIDALEKVQLLLSENKDYNDIKQVYAVSSILRGPILDVFKNLNFNTRCIPIKDAREDSEFAKFYEIFKSGKYIGSASLLKENILSKEWIKNKEKFKIRLRQELEIEDELKPKNNLFISGLKRMVNSENDIIDNKNSEDVQLNKKKNISKEEVIE